jgi:hypothetical protein
MASTLDSQSVPSLPEGTDVVVIDEEEFVAAQHDPRVRKFLKESDAYLAKLEAEGRNR